MFTVNNSFETYTQSEGMKRGMYAYNDNSYINSYIKTLHMFWLDNNITAIDEYITNYLINND